jgi:ParB-like chromosome segregation protein Spo0J
MPYVLRPIPFPRDACRDSQTDERPEIIYPEIHPFQQALRWQRELATDSQLTKSGIAKREGLSRARVTQIMNLLLLPELIQQELQNPPPPLKIDLFHEHRLRVLLAQNDKVRQLHDWQQWIEELRAFG